MELFFNFSTFGFNLLKGSYSGKMLVLCIICFNSNIVKKKHTRKCSRMFKVIVLLSTMRIHHNSTSIWWKIGGIFCPIIAVPRKFKSPPWGQPRTFIFMGYSYSYSYSGFFQPSFLHGIWGPNSRVIDVLPQDMDGIIHEVRIQRDIQTDPFPQGV